MKLLVAVKQRRSRLRGGDVNLHLLPGGDNDHVLSDARTWGPGIAHQVERMPVKVDRMGMGTLVVEKPPISTVGVNDDVSRARV